jgi:CubicO group peptidase (beta-lactamase class C family)
MIKKQLYPITALSFLLSISLCLTSVFAGPTAEPQKNRVSSSESVLDLEDSLLSYMESGHMPSLSVCIIKGGEVIWSKSYGYANLRQKTNATTDTIYLAGSISKVVTATALMQLYEQGRFNLDDDINTYLPFNLRNPSYPDTPITIRMLLAHQSSLGNKEILPFIFLSLLNVSNEFLQEFFTSQGKFYTPGIWRNVPPGEEAYYSSVGYDVLGYLIEQLTNQSYETYCHDHIFTPLNMHNTSSQLTNLTKNNLATPYLWLLGHYIPLPNYEIDNLCAAAGGLQTTANDLSHLMIVHMNNGTYNNIHLLNKETIDLMHRIQYPGSEKHNIRRYGLGWCIGPTLPDGTHLEGHEGAVPGGNSYMLYSSSEAVGVIYLTNQYSYIVKPMELLSWIGLRNRLFLKADTIFRV